MPPISTLLRPVLLSATLLSAPLACAWEVFELQPGASRSDVADALEEYFPQESELTRHASVPSKFFNVIPFDGKRCEQQSMCMATWSEQETESRRLVRSESVQAAFNRSGKLMSIRHQSEQKPEDSCQEDLQEQLEQFLDDSGKPTLQSSLRRGGTEYQQLLWGNCTTQALCYQVSMGCNRQGMLEVETSLSDMSLRNQ